MTLERFRAGDAQAFAEVVRAYGPLVRGAVARYWRSAFEREEAMQEIWVHVYRGREALDPGRLETFSGWLAVLVRHRCLDLLRRPTEAAPASTTAEAAALAWLEAAPEQETSLEQAELRRAVEAFKVRLRPAWRDFFELHFVEGLDYGAVGERLGIGSIRCKYMRKVLAARARRNRALLAALGRTAATGGDRAS
ncbi:MAG: sigma-70 family RNA polymerase sigma factor [Deltaproteobacteria bacterium]|nr:sigma-70 family RNA polymerase sigma factor [Deltaproteobacteria bacterium]